jgi:hypothetical protein
MAIGDWRYDAVGVPLTGEAYAVYWDLGCDCQFLHPALRNRNLRHDWTSGESERHCVDKDSLDVLTMARPGKAPRKICDFKTALERVIASKRDTSGAVGAQRILLHLSRFLE